jgi:hypothetical protein
MGGGGRGKVTTHDARRTQDSMKSSKRSLAPETVSALRIFVLRLLVIANVVLAR